MIEIKYIVTLATIVMGMVYMNKDARNSLKRLFSHEYVEWRDFNSMLERQRLLGKV